MPHDVTHLKTSQIDPIYGMSDSEGDRRQVVTGDLQERGLAPRPVWRELSRRLESLPLKDIKILLVGFDHKLSLQLREVGVGTTAWTPRVASLGDMGALCNAFTHLVVNFDRFTDTEEGVDMLLDFRKRCPHVVVILVSSDVARDDFGSERAAICDATLRSPWSKERMRKGLTEAWVNNVERRLRENVNPKPQ